MWPIKQCIIAHWAWYSCDYLSAYLPTYPPYLPISNYIATYFSTYLHVHNMYLIVCLPCLVTFSFHFIQSGSGVWVAANVKSVFPLILSSYLSSACQTLYSHFLGMSSWQGLMNERYVLNFSTSIRYLGWEALQMGQLLQEPNCKAQHQWNTIFLRDAQDPSVVSWPVLHPEFLISIQEHGWWSVIILSPNQVKCSCQFICACAW